MHCGALQYFIPGNPPLTPAPNPTLSPHPPTHHAQCTVCTQHKEHNPPTLHSVHTPHTAHFKHCQQHTALVPLCSYFFLNIFPTFIHFAHPHTLKSMHNTKHTHLKICDSQEKTPVQTVRTFPHCVLSNVLTQVHRGEQVMKSTLCKQRGGVGYTNCTSAQRWTSAQVHCTSTSAQVHCANRGEWRWQLPQ